jgi:hypothetical protein
VGDDSAFSLADFDRYVEEHGIPEKDLPEAFAQWLANLTGGTITGEPADGEGPTFKAEPGSALRPARSGPLGCAACLASSRKEKTCESLS